MKKKSTIYILIVIIAILTIFNFIATQTDVLQKTFGIYLNSAPVLVATKTFYENDTITPDGVEVKYVPKDFLLANPDTSDTSTYVLTNVKQLEQGLVAKDMIVQGEQIAVKRLMPASELQNTKTLVYPITIDYYGAAGNSLYVNDKAYLFYTYTDKETTVTEKLYDGEITIVDLKNSDGLSINKNRAEAAVIPSSAFIRVEENDIVKINALKQKGAIFFFVKSANN